MPALGNSRESRPLSMIKRAMPLLFPSEIKRIANLPQNQRYAEAAQGAFALVIPIETGGTVSMQAVSPQLMTKIYTLKQQGLKFMDILKRLSPEEKAVAMQAIKPPSLVQHEAQRIAGALE